MVLCELVEYRERDDRRYMHAQTYWPWHVQRLGGTVNDHQILAADRARMQLFENSSNVVENTIVIIR